MWARYLASLAFSVALLPFCTVGRADDPDDAHIRQAFSKVWQARHDTRTDRDELVVGVYRDAWPGRSRWATDLDMVTSLKLFPDDASAESILRGQHGDASPWRLWDSAMKSCLNMFTQRPDPIIKALATDFQGDLNCRRKAHEALSEWQRHLYHLSWQRNEGSEPAKRLLERIATDLYPVVSKRFVELEATSPIGGDPLVYALRDLNNPLAIPLLLGKDGRHLKQNCEFLRNLQRERKADPGLIKLLTDADPQVRWRATYALANSRDVTLASHATRLLQDATPEVRREALDFAYFLLSPDRPDLDTQFKALLKDPDPKVRQRCVILLAQRKDIACARALLDLLRNEKTDEWLHSSLIQAMQNLTGETFGYHIGSDGWLPTTPNNRAALEKFAVWIAQQSKDDAK